MDDVYKNIISNKQFGLKDKIKRLLYYLSRRRGAKKAWNNRHQKVFALHGSYNKRCSAEIETAHQKKWSAFRQNVDMSTLRICKNISGQADARIIPEDIFVSDIEPTLITDESGHFLSHKSFYNRWFPDGVFPRDIFHCINGQYLDSALNPISFDELKEQAGRISYPVVIKPNWETYGGEDIHFANDRETLIPLCDGACNFVVQARILQHEYFAKYNPVGLNTIRVYVYKSVSDNTFHILNMALRMGRGGSLDNLSAGGIQSMIRRDGFLNGYAVDKYGQRFTKHPDTGYLFEDQIPAFDKLKKLALKIGEQVFFTRIIGLDLCYDESGSWKVIEINTKGHTIRFAQYGGQPFFGDFTDEVIEYCQTKHWTLNASL